MGKLLSRLASTGRLGCALRLRFGTFLAWALGCKSSVVPAWGPVQYRASGTEPQAVCGTSHGQVAGAWGRRAAASCTRVRCTGVSCPAQGHGS